jgi:hypothetical protein
MLILSWNMVAILSVGFIISTYCVYKLLEGSGVLDHDRYE